MTAKLTVILVIPVVLSVVMMAVFAGRYGRSIGRMAEVAQLKPVIGEEIPAAVWDVVSGRKTMKASGVDGLIADAEDTISRVAADTGESDRLDLIVAGRTMDTLRLYVDQIRGNIEGNAPVADSEKVLGDIRDVAELVVSMLNDYITEEIRTTAEMSTHLGRMALLTAGAELLLLIAALIITHRYSRRTARFVREPIEKLESVTAQLAAGDMSARLPLTQVAELWNLTGQVNVMADNLEKMMAQSVRDERNLKKAELRTLQAQINPHFLYNTLDAIVWKAEAGDEEEVIRLTRALSDFFRISLSSGADWIPIRQERKHIAGYLSIQKTRYSDILNYEIDIPDEIGDFYILKLLLQPLVENALYHGIKYRRGGGMIRVSARKEDDRLVFTVQDTGRGMDAATLEGIRRRMAERQPEHAAGMNGFGLVNVNLRIRLYYNQPEGLQIESGADGTTVSFRVPCRTEEDIAHDQSVSG